MNAAQRTLEVLLLFTQVDHDFSEQKFTPSTLTSSVQNNVNDKSFYFQYLLNVLFLIGWKSLQIFSLKIDHENCRWRSKLLFKAAP